MYLQQNMRCRKYYHACRTDNSIMTWQNVVIISVLEVVILLLLLLRLICHSMSYNLICSSKDTVFNKSWYYEFKRKICDSLQYILQYVSESPTYYYLNKDHHSILDGISCVTQDKNNIYVMVRFISYCLD